MEKATDICRASEITSSQMKALNDEVNVHKVESIKPKKRDTKSEQTSVMRKECSRCGNKHEYRKCPAYGKTCQSCQKKNHFAKMCNTKDLQSQSKRMHVIEQDGNMFIGTVTVENERNVMSINSSKEDEQWVETIQINKNDVKVTLDTGAECNVMSERV